MTCASCGAAVHPAADFCRVCGADAPSAAGTTPRLHGIDSLRALRMPRLSTWHLPALSLRAPREAGEAIGRAGRRAAAAAPLAPALHLGASAVPTRLAIPRLSARALLIVGVAAAALLAIVLLTTARPGGASSAVSGQELAAAQAAVVQRDERIRTLEAAVATHAQAQSALQQSVQSAQQESTTLREERDAMKQQASGLEAKVTQTEASLREQEALATRLQQELKTLSSCLSGTAVAVAFGRTGRWSSADLALQAVGDSCRAAEPLLRR